MRSKLDRDTLPETVEKRSHSVYHQTRFTYNPERAVVWRVIGGYVQRFVLTEHALLDLGAGYGEFSRFISAKQKWALDTNSDLISYWPAEINPLIQTLPGRLPLPSGSLGTILASNFFEHFTIDECAEILDELYRTLIPGGRLLIIQPNFRLQPYRYFDDFTHKTPFTDVGFTDFLRSRGWKIIYQEPRFLPFSMKSRIPKRAWMVRLYLALPYRPAAGQFLVVAETPATR